MFANNLSYHKVKKVKVSLTSGSRLESCISDEETPEVRGLPKAATRRQRSLGFVLSPRGHCANVLSTRYLYAFFVSVAYVCLYVCTCMCAFGCMCECSRVYVCASTFVRPLVYVVS